MAHGPPGAHLYVRFQPVCSVWPKAQILTARVHGRPTLPFISVFTNILTPVRRASQHGGRCWPRVRVPVPLWLGSQEKADFSFGVTQPFLFLPQLRVFGDAQKMTAE